MLDVLSLMLGWLLGVVSLLGGLMLGKRAKKPAPIAGEAREKESIDRQWRNLMAYRGTDQTLEERDDESEN